MIKTNLQYARENLESLYGLHNLTSIGNTLSIFGTGGLEDLSGLESLTSVEHIAIGLNDALTTLRGIEGVDSCNNIHISHNHNLTSLMGLDSLKYVKENLTIYDNLGLTKLSGIHALNHVGQTLCIWSNHFMTSLSGLDNLTLIDGNLKIIDNFSLSDLECLENIEALAIDTLFIFENPNLSTCNLNFICDYISETGSLAEIYENATGCNSPEEVLDSCDLTSINTYTTDQITSLHPNPFNTSITIEYQLNQPSVVQLIIYDYLGNQVEVIDQNQSQGKQQIIWNAEGLPAGVYFCMVKIESETKMMKMIKL